MRQWPWNHLNGRERKYVYYKRCQSRTIKERKTNNTIKWSIGKRTNIVLIFSNTIPPENGSELQKTEQFLLQYPHKSYCYQLKKIHPLVTRILWCENRQRQFGGYIRLKLQTYPFRFGYFTPHKTFKGINNLVLTRMPFPSNYFRFRVPSIE